MSRPTPTIAVPPPVTSSNSEDITSPLTQQPRASVNAGVHSMLAAAIGLTSLGAPSSPSKASPSPSRSGVKDFTTQASGGAVDVAGNGNASRVTRDTDKLSFMNNKINKPSPALSKVLKPVIKEMIATAILHPRPAAMVMMAPHLIRPPAHYHCHLNNRPPYPALRVAKAAARPSALKRPTPWSSIRPSPAGFDTRHMPFNPHSAPPFANAAIAMDRFSIGERIAAMDRAAAAAAFASRPSPYDPYYPPYASLPPLPTPHQTTPVPSNKNFPETLFDVISSEEHAHIISWLPHGEGFIIHDKQRFSSMMLPRYFDGAKFTSFTRRLKRWSFVRVPRGPELGAYYSKNFVRGHLQLVQKMRYRMDGQFEEGKKKSDDKNEENEKLEEQTEKEVESKEAQVEDSSPRLIGQANCKPHQNQVLPVIIPNPEIKTLHLTNPQDRPMPLSSTLPKRPKAAKKTGTAIETLRDHPTTTVEFSSFPRGHPTLTWPNDPNEQRLMEMQQELLMDRSMMPLTVTPSGASATRSIMGSSSYYTNNSTAQRMRSVSVEVERAERILEAEHMLGQNHLSNTNSNNPNQERIASNILGSSKTHENGMDTAVRDMQSRMAPPFLHLSERPPPRSNGHESYESSAYSQRERQNMSLPMSYNRLSKISQGEHSMEGLCEAQMTIGEARSGRAVMMSCEEEEEFARYLIMKRSGY
mmetsp:Transcript_17102/g.30192  ORF Transcript_17102/g.30192 Transcript_17102/m.30192 type:complete len:698 (-) Transcript_17102:128-2221(-)